MGDQMENALEKAMRAQEDAIRYARVMCPRWLLTWSEAIYGTRGISSEDCAKIAEASKHITEVFEKQVMHIPDLVLKQKALAYISAMIKTAELYENYYRTGDDKLLEKIDQCKAETLTHEKVINSLLTG